MSPDGLTLGSDERFTPWSGPGAALIPAGEFEAQSGIRGVNPGSSEILGYYAEAHFHRSEAAVLSSGTLMVQGVSCAGESCILSVHSDVRWPMDESAQIALCRL